MVPDKKYYTIYTSNDFSVNFMFILHVAKRNVQLYMPNLNGLAKIEGKCRPQILSNLSRYLTIFAK